MQFVRFFFWFYVFTSRSAFFLRPPGAEEDNREYGIDKNGDWGWFYRFYRHSLFGTASGGSIFRCTTKDGGERRAKGVATPFNPPELMQNRKPDVLWLYVFALVQLTRLSRLRCREANTLGVRCRLFPCLCVLHCPEGLRD